MIAFWISAAVLSALAAALVVQRSEAAAAAMRLSPEDPTLAVFRRQLTEIDDLAERGLLPEAERRSARAEAARRLLSAADRSVSLPPPAASGRWLVGGAAAVAPLVAMGVYLLVGSPGMPDQPFAGRLAAWRAADPSSLSPPQMAALLSRAVADHPDDPSPLYYLARVQVALGQAGAAEHDLRRAITLAPARADLWSMLGVVLATQSGGESSPEAMDALRKAHALDPANPDARYFLARARIAGGDVDGGLADWRALAIDIPQSDPRKAALAQEIAEIEKTRALPQAQIPGAAGPAAGAAEQQAFIQAMVARLAARLQDQPDDPAGWARLIHAYGVLGKGPEQAAARARALAQFKGDPAGLRTIEVAR